jgi:hypothetical protein
MSVITNTNATTKVNMLFVERDINNTIQYSFVVEDQHICGSDNLIATTTCSAAADDVVNLINLNSDNAFKAFYKAMSN